MQDLCIHKSVIGTDDNLVVKCDGTREWTQTIPEDLPIFAGALLPETSRCLATALRLEHRSAPIFGSEKWFNILSELNYKGEVRWSRLVSAREHETLLNAFVPKLVEALTGIDLRYLESTWVNESVFLSQLERARVDAEQWRYNVFTERGNVSATKTFMPHEDGLAARVIYDRFATRTGRLTVESGPNILTLNRSMRDMIIPREPGRAVFQADFAALEPRIIMYEAGKRCTHHDLYEHVASTANLSVDRSIVKQVIISELYGSSHHKLEDELGTTLAQRIIDAVTQVFNIKHLARRLREQYTSDLFIRNRYGRKVLIDDPRDSILVNLYTQSTGVDVSLLGFIQLMEDLGSEFTPLFVLHDALIIEGPSIPSGYTCVRVPGYVQNFIIKFKELIA